MANYDYTNGKKRIDEILKNKLDVIYGIAIPADNDFTFTNAYNGWVTGLFVDIKDSTTLFSFEDKEMVEKIIRSFTSEVIEILRDDVNRREIGIRGDCVYAVYTTPNKKDILKIFNKSIEVNTFMKMLNKLLNKKGGSNIKVGIGISTAKELVVKAGRSGTGINNLVWIGQAVTLSSKFASLGNKDGYKPIVLSECTHTNIIEEFIEQNGKGARNWFTKNNSNEVGMLCYEADLTSIEFSDWIDNNI